jgi:two-component system nitrogen regulation sensor histidine kinase NtrY
MTNDVRTQQHSQAELRKRKREWFIITISLAAILTLAFAQFHLTKLSSEVPMVSNILIFGLINIIALLVILLLYLLARNIFKLAMERRLDMMGTRLRTKLVIAFVGLSLFPTMLLFFVSAGYISNSIQNWFNKQVETSLDESMEVAQTYYKNSAANALYYSRQISQMIKSRKLLNDENQAQLRELIRQKQKEYNLGVVEVFSAQREELVRAANPTIPPAEMTSPSSADLDVALHGKELSRVTSVGKADLIRGIVPVYSNWFANDVVGVVVVNYFVPYSLVSKMKEITSSYHEFRQLKILRRPITTTYILTLLLITTVIITLAVWFGINLARSLTGPIQELADATQQIADGNLDITLSDAGDDEIGQLVSSFNKMAEDLRTNQFALQEANTELLSSNQALEERRRYMETVLRHITAGVIATNKTGEITTFNDSAERLLNLRKEETVGRHFRDVLQAAHLDVVKEMLRDIVLSKQDILDKQVTIQGVDTKLILRVNLAILRDESGDFLGTVVVFDDLTHLLKAQRMAAWREVARRIAHEIKNPLTPIQLSAQRLRKRYLQRFTDDDLVFDQSTETIIKSVEELKTLVNEFSQFARMPAAQPAPCQLNGIISEALNLYSEAHRDIDFRADLSGAIPELMLDRDQMKRVMINLFSNAVSAIEGEGVISVESRYDQGLGMVTITISDTGHGIAPEDKPRLFEPYFSTRKTGTGLGLSIVNQIISDHHGYIRVKDNSPKGTKFIVELPSASTI